MDYPQDLINRTLKSAQEHLKRKAQINEHLSVQSLVNILLREDIPENLARSTAENLIVAETPKNPRKAGRYLGIGFALLALGVLVILASYWYSAGNFIYISGLILVPDMAYLGAGIWELLD